MRIALVALLFGGFVLSGCGRTLETLSYGGNTNGYSNLENGLPNCVGENPNFWHGCNGIVSMVWVDAVGTPVDSEWSTVSSYRNGKRHGRGMTANERTHELCEVTYVNGLIDGWITCRNVFGTQIETKKFFENGKESPQQAQEVVRQDQKSECAELGFTPNTPEFGNCVLKLRELAQGSKSATVIQPAPVQSSPTTADKIEGTRQILEAIRGVSAPTQSTGKQIDLSCVNVCQAQGKSLMYCRSDCAF
jgi:hypothetical protein